MAEFDRIEVAAKALLPDYQLLLIKTQNAMTPLTLRITVYAESHINLELTDAYGSTVWERNLALYGGHYDDLPDVDSMLRS